MYSVHTYRGFKWTQCSGSNVRRRRRRDFGGQVVVKLVLSCCPGTNTLHYTGKYRDKYTTLQEQIYDRENFFSTFKVSPLYTV